MAREQLELIDREIALSLTESQVKAIHGAYDRGQRTLADAGAELAEIGILPAQRSNIFDGVVMGAHRAHENDRDWANPRSGQDLG